MRPPAQTALLRAIAYLAIAIAWCWPLPLHLANRFSHDPGDPLLVTYLIWWNAHAVPFTRAWWNAPFFWPMPAALATTEHLAGLSPLTTPIQWLGGSPLLAYNLALIASNWWCALATDALVRRLTRSGAAAAIAALAFTYAPYRTGQLGHLQLYACWWMPLLLYGLHRYIEDGRRWWLALFGTSWLLQALTNGYSLLFLPVLIGAWIAWFTPWRTAARRAAWAFGAWVLFSLPLLPVLLEYFLVQRRMGLSRSPGEIHFYSGTWKDFLHAAPELAFWHTAAPPTTEAYLFPGVTVIVLLIVGVAMRLRSRAFWFYTAVAVLTALLCLGPSMAGISFSTLWHPYDVLMLLPGFNGIRVPARFFLITALCLAVAAGIAIAAVLPRGRWRRPILAAVFAGLAIDGAIAGMPIGIPPGTFPFAERGARLISLPYDDGALTTRTMYQSMEARLPIANGYGGYVPPSADVMQWGLRREDPTIVDVLRRGHPLLVIVGASDRRDRDERFIRRLPGATLLGVTDTGTVYRLAPAPYPPQLPPQEAVTATTASTPDALVADLGATRAVTSIEVKTYDRLTLLPASVSVDGSSDGRTWTALADERPGGAAFEGALRDPIAIPVRIAVTPMPVRYVRVNTPRFPPSALTVFAQR